MNMAPKTTAVISSARVEIDCVTLARLLASGQVHLCELRCLDPQTKQVLRRLILNNCVACAAIT